MRKYDIYIAVPIWPQVDLKDNNDLEIFKKRGWAGLELELKKAKETLAKIKQFRAGGYVVDTAYKNPKITLSEAREIATREYERRIENGTRLNTLSEGFDDIICWTFQAEDIDALEKDLIPGRISISIDKIDGHLRTTEEYKDWIKFSTV